MSQEEKEERNISIIIINTHKDRSDYSKEDVSNEIEYLW